MSPSSIRNSIEPCSPVPVGRGPLAIAAGLGGIWVGNSLDGTVSRIDPGTQAVTAVDIGGTPSGLAVGAGVVVASDGSGSVKTIDPTSRSVTTIPIGISRQRSRA